MKQKLLLLISLFFSAGLMFSQVEDYTFSSNSGTFTPVSGGTDVDVIEGDDRLSPVLPIGFTFTYDDDDYTQVRASSNGWLKFNLTDSQSANGNDLKSIPVDYRPLLAPLWDDLAGNAGGSQAKYITTGTTPNRVFTMEWYKWKWNYGSSNDVISFQVKLYETTNVIEFVYQQGAITPNNPSASIGINSSAIGTGNFLSLDGTGTSPTVSSITENTNLSTRPATGQVYTFTPPVPAPVPVSDWAIYLVIFLIAGFVVYRVRKTKLA